jgi:hypothetical protein
MKHGLGSTRLRLLNLAILGFVLTAACNWVVAFCPRLVVISSCGSVLLVRRPPNDLGARGDWDSHTAGLSHYLALACPCFELAMGL